ncbi:hypothetical protein GF357_04840 [Candidatus Dojkabacteria bacterium]|nr:hypothetical protein [Candidatus Dojkabacteria bacterium]
MAKVEKEYSWYFDAVIIFSIVRIAVTVITLVPFLNCVVALVTAPLMWGWTIFSIVMLIVFLVNKLPAQFWGFPVYYLASIFVNLGILGISMLLFPERQFLQGLVLAGYGVSVEVAALILSSKFKDMFGGK